MGKRHWRASCASSTCTTLRRPSPMRNGVSRNTDFAACQNAPNGTGSGSNADAASCIALSKSSNAAACPRATCATSKVEGSIGPGADNSYNSPSRAAHSAGVRSSERHGSSVSKRASNRSTGLPAPAMCRNAARPALGISWRTAKSNSSLSTPGASRMAASVSAKSQPPSSASTVPAR